VVQWGESRAWRIVNRVWINAVKRYYPVSSTVKSRWGREERTSSSAFLAPRMASKRSRSPSPDRRKESSILPKLAGGAGYPTPHQFTSRLTRKDEPALHPTISRPWSRRTRVRDLGTAFPRDRVGIGVGLAGGRFDRSWGGRGNGISDGSSTGFGVGCMWGDKGGVGVQYGSGRGRRWSYRGARSEEKGTE